MADHTPNAAQDHGEGDPFASLRAPKREITDAMREAREVPRSFEPSAACVGAEVDESAADRENRLNGDHSAASPSPQILDACCGGRHWWWDKAHPLAVHIDVREAPRGSVGVLTGHPEWNPNWSCEPDVLADFTAMPFEDEAFQLVVFDPPHVTREKQPPEGINGLKYGALHPETEQEDLRLGFAECWRVLRPGGTLVFKWGAGSIKRVQPHFPATPIVGTRSPRGGQTRWFIFYKPLVAAALEVVA